MPPQSRSLKLGFGCCFLVASMVLAGCRGGGLPNGGQPVTLTISAAADLGPAFREIGSLFEQQTGIKTNFNFGSTGQLAQQIEQGAPVDLVAAADVRRIDALEARNRILTFREQVVSEAFEALQARLQRFKREPGYADFLMRALAEGVERVSGKAFVVELGGDDLELLAANARKWAEDRGLALELRPQASLEGGLRVYTGDRHLLYDNSLSARLRRNEDDLRREIWRRVFGGDRESS